VSALIATVLWQRVDVPGLEYGRLWSGPDGYRFEGTLIVNEGQPWRVHYEVDCSPAWETRSAAISLTAGAETRELRLKAEPTGLAGLAGCVDVDVSLTPATNTLPIRRLGLLDLAVGESREVTAAWVDFPALSVEPLPQRYTRLAGRRFDYESGGGTFRTELEVDDAGLVVAYPPFWRRVTISTRDFEETPA
jgi:hypothetical protein